MTTKLLTRAPAPDDSSASGSSHSADDDAALAASVAAAFLLSDEQVTQLERAIYTGRLASYRATYLAAAQAADVATIDGVALSDWEPDDAVVDACQADAQSSAQSIATTYQRDVTAAAVAYLATYRDANDGEMRGAASALSSHLYTWATERAPSKAQQVAQYETSSAGTDGVQDAASDALDDLWADDAGDALDVTQWLIAIVPEESSSDFCANYAGNVYALDDAPSLDFPAHPGCIHYTVFIPLADASEYDDGSDDLSFDF